MDRLAGIAFDFQLRLKSNAVACRLDAAILATHESKDFSGGVIASLSLPWGEIHGDQDVGGYHLVWPRDAYESSSALLAAWVACGSPIARWIFLRSRKRPTAIGRKTCGLTERSSVSTFSSMKLPRRFCCSISDDVWAGVPTNDCERLWPMIRGAAAYIAANGPSSPPGPLGRGSAD